MKAFLVNFIYMSSLIVCAVASLGQNTIQCGLIDFYPLYVFYSTMYLHGLDIDVTKAFCQQLKAQSRFTAMPLADLFSNLNQNKVDANISAISFTEQRKKHLEFSRPYIKSSMSFTSLLDANFKKAVFTHFLY